MNYECLIQPSTRGIAFGTAVKCVESSKQSQKISRVGCHGTWRLDAILQNSGSVQRISRPISMYRDTLKPRTVCPHHIIVDGPKILGFITFEAKLSLTS